MMTMSADERYLPRVPVHFENMIGDIVTVLHVRDPRGE